jgi:hypothetical protein
MFCLHVSHLAVFYSRLINIGRLRLRPATRIRGDNLCRLVVFGNVIKLFVYYNDAVFIGEAISK